MNKPTKCVLSLAFVVLQGCGIDPTAQLAAMGDSVTWGYGDLPGGWINTLELRSGQTISNLGIPGERAAGGLDRVDQALAVVPGATVVMLLHGGNDWVGIFRGGKCNKNCDPKEFEAEYLQVGEQLTAIGEKIRAQNKKVVYATYWPGSPAACTDYDPAQFVLYQLHLARLNSEIVGVATRAGDNVVRLDELKEISNDPLNWFDCLHPSKQGYEMVANRWLKDAHLWEP